MPKGVYLHTKLIGNKHRVGKIPWNKGKKGMQIVSQETRSLHRIRMLGNKFNPGLKGKDSPNWRGGKTHLNTLLRSTYEYKLWRRAVYERDKFTCVWCSKVGGKLNADHIKPFALFPELRFAIDNGRTLCIDCHKTTETYAGKGNRKIFRHNSDQKDIQPKETD